MKYKITLYQEIYSDFEVEANSEKEASDMVISGQAGEPNDVTVKESDVISCKSLDSKQCPYCGSGLFNDEGECQECGR